MKKRGISRTVLISIVLLVFCGIILFAVVPKIRELTAREITKETCRSSVMLRAAVIEKSGIAEALGRIQAGRLPLRCKTQNICFSMGGECRPGFQRIDVTDESELKSKIAGLMADCWWQFLEGRKNFFGRLTDDEHCMICSVVDFDDEIERKIPSVRDFTGYLNSAIWRGNITYWQYITNNPKERVNISIDILTSNRYLIIFSYISKDLLAPMIGAGVGAGTLGIGGALAGSWAAGKAGAIVGSFAGPVGAGVGFAIGFTVGAIGGYKAAEGVRWVVGQVKTLFGIEKEYVSSLLFVPFTTEVLKTCSTIESIP